MWRSSSTREGRKDAKRQGQASQILKHAKPVGVTNNLRHQKSFCELLAFLGSKNIHVGD